MSRAIFVSANIESTWLEAGDLLAIPMAGVYTLAMAKNYTWRADWPSCWSRAAQPG